jgi:mRNA interferase MazF
MVIEQGDIFWIDMEIPYGSEPGYRRPYLVIQNDIFNRSRIQTVVVCALTTNLHLAQARGNVLLKKGEANLSKSSVINISQILTVDKTQFREKIGTLSKARLDEVFDGVSLLLERSE